jgi:hypothetical protein
MKTNEVGTSINSRMVQIQFVHTQEISASYIQKIPEKESYKAKGASFPSIVDIFVHVLDAYRFWFLFVYKDKLSDMWRLREKKRYSEKEVANDERKIDRFVLNFVNKLTARDLSSTVAEMNALFWQMDIDPPVIGIDDLNLRTKKIT